MEKGVITSQTDDDCGLQLLSALPLSSCIRFMLDIQRTRSFAAIHKHTKIIKFVLRYCPTILLFFALLIDGIDCVQTSSTAANSGSLSRFILDFLAMSASQIGLFFGCSTTFTFIFHRRQFAACASSVFRLTRRFKVSSLSRQSDRYRVFGFVWFFTYCYILRSICFFALRTYTGVRLLQTGDEVPYAFMSTSRGTCTIYLEIVLSFALICSLPTYVVVAGYFSAFSRCCAVFNTELTEVVRNLLNDSFSYPKSEFRDVLRKLSRDEATINSVLGEISRTCSKVLIILIFCSTLGIATNISGLFADGQALVFNGHAGNFVLTGYWSAFLILSISVLSLFGIFHKQVLVLHLPTQQRK